MRDAGRAGLAAVLVLLIAAPAHADPAETELQKGIDLFALAQFDASRTALEQARRLTRQPKLLARIHLYIGFNDAAIGASARARNELLTALGYDPTLQVDAQKLRKELVDLFNDVRRTEGGELEVSAAAAEATVIVDGQRRGGLPFKSRLAIGSHAVEVLGADGTRVFNGQVIVRPHRTTRLLAPLATASSRLAVQSRPSGAEVRLDGQLLGTTPLAPVSVKPGTHGLVVQLPGRPAQTRQVRLAPAEQLTVEVSWDDAPAPRRRGWLLGRRWTWLTLGGAICSLGAGIGVAVSAQSDFSTWETRCRGRNDASCMDLRYSISDRDIAANVLFGVAGGLLVTSAVLFFVERPSSAPQAKERTLRAGRVSFHPSVGRLVGGSLSVPF